MTLNRPKVVWPGTARLTLALLAGIPATMTYPWQSTADRWVLGVGAAVVIVLLSWWHGLHLTTILGLRLTLLRRGRRVHQDGHRELHHLPTDTRITVVLRIAPRAGSRENLPLPLITAYLDRYGIRCDTIRVTSHDTGAHADRSTWIGLTLSATANLPALRARSEQLPLQETAVVVQRRLADHLRETGWDASAVDQRDIPELFGPDARETWNALADSNSGFVSGYRIAIDAALPQTLAAVWSYPARETWTVLEFTGSGEHPVAAAACAFRTDDAPAASTPLPGLVSQRGRQGVVLSALHPTSVHRLDRRYATTLSPAELSWPCGTALVGA